MSWDADTFEFDELTVTRGIVQSFIDDFLEALDVNVAVVGAGPSGLTAARLLARDGHKVAVFERHLHIGGGIWGGGMLFPRIVIEDQAAELMREIGVELREWEDGTVIADAVEAATKMTAAAIDAGARIFVGIEVEDVVVDDDERVCGVVLNWGAVPAAGLHVDPLGVHADAVIDGSGHPCEIAQIVEAKVPGARLDSGFDFIPGEGSMNVRKGEAALVPNTREVYPGLIVTGMAANAINKSHRMGAIFGGMLLSGQRAAQLASEMVG